jgi:hypothetical protein
MKNDMNENPALSKTSVMVSAECKHSFESVYYGSEWVVECEKCEKDVFDLYSKEDANAIINEYLKNLKK